jgi:transcriptional regulator with XRE-family HTH domain
MNQYEQGRHTPSPAVLAKIGLVLQLPLPFFFAQEDDLAELIEAYARERRAPDRSSPTIENDSVES